MSNNPPSAQGTQNKDVHDPVSDSPPFVTGDPKQRCTWSCVWQPSLCYRGPKAKMYLILCPTTLPLLQRTQNKDVHDLVSDNPPFVTWDPKQRCTWSCVRQPSLCYRGPKAKMYMVSCLTTLCLLQRTQNKDVHDPVFDNPPFVTGDPKQRCTWSCVRQPSLCDRGPETKMYMILCPTTLPLLQATLNKDVHDPVSDNPPFFTGAPKQRCTWSRVWQPSLCYWGPKTKMYMILCPTTLPLLQATQNKDVHDPVSDNPPFVTEDPKQRYTWSCVRQPSLCYRGPKTKMYMILCPTTLPLLQGTQNKDVHDLVSDNPPFVTGDPNKDVHDPVSDKQPSVAWDVHDLVSDIHPSVTWDPKQRWTWTHVQNPSLCCRGPKAKMYMISCLTSIPLLQGTQNKDWHDPMSEIHPSVTWDPKQGCKMAWKWRRSVNIFICRLCVVVQSKFIRPKKYSFFSFFFFFCFLIYASQGTAMLVYSLPVKGSKRLAHGLFNTFAT